MRKTKTILIFSFFLFVISLNYFLCVNYDKNAFALTEEQENKVKFAQDDFDIEFGVIKVSLDNYAFLVMYKDENNEIRFLKQDSIVPFDYFHLKVLDLQAENFRNNSLVNVKIYGYTNIIYNQTTGFPIGYESMHNYTQNIRMTSIIVGLNIELETTKDIEFIRVEYNSVWFLFMHQSLKENIPINYTLLTMTQRTIVYGVVSIVLFVFWLVGGWLVSRKARKIDLPEIVTYFSLALFGGVVVLFMVILRLYLWSQIVYFTGLSACGFLLGIKLYSKDFEKIMFWKMQINTYNERVTRHFRIFTYQYYYLFRKGENVKAIIQKGFKNSLQRLFGVHTILVIDNRAVFDYVEHLNADRIAMIPFVPVDEINFKSDIFKIQKKKDKEKLKFSGHRLEVTTTSQVQMGSKEYGHRLITIVNTEKKLSAVEQQLNRVLAQDVASEYERMSKMTEELLSYIGMVFWLQSGDVSEIPAEIKKQLGLSEESLEKESLKYYEKIKGEKHERDKSKTR